MQFLNFSLIALYRYLYLYLAISICISAKSNLANLCFQCLIRVIVINCCVVAAFGGLEKDFET